MDQHLVHKVGDALGLQHLPGNVGSLALLEDEGRTGKHALGAHARSDQLTRVIAVELLRGFCMPSSPVALTCSPTNPYLGTPGSPLSLYM